MMLVIMNMLMLMLIGVVLVATVTDVLHGFIPSVPVIPIYYAAMVGALATMVSNMVHDLAAVRIAEAARRCPP